MNINNLISVIGAIVAAILGVSGVGFFIYKRGNTKQVSNNGNNSQNNQNISGGSNNIQASGNVDIKTKDWK